VKEHQNINLDLDLHLNLNVNLNILKFICKIKRLNLRPVAVQDAIAASLLAPSGSQLVLDQSAAPVPELDAVLDGQRWAFEHSDPPAVD